MKKTNEILAAFGSGTATARKQALTIVSGRGIQNPLACLTDNELEEAIRVFETGDSAAKKAMDAAIQEKVKQRHAVPVYDVYGLADLTEDQIETQLENLERGG